jgi:cysteine desulfurase
VAALIGAAPSEIVFTSGGTEAVVLGILGLARAAAGPRRVVTTPIEHPAVRGAVETLAAEGFEIVRVAVDGDGRIDPDEVRGALDGGAALATLALAQNELGNVYDVPAFAAAARALGVALHTDAVQAVGKLPVDVRALAVDALALSAHKIHGPKGAGALWLRGGVAFAPAPGGHQERGLRPGTENVIGIVGFGAAAAVCRAAPAGALAEQARLRDRLERAALMIPGARRHGDPEHRVPNTSNLAFRGVPGDILVAALDLEGVAASTGSACTSGTVEPSAVLLGLGLSRERAAEAVRLSLGRDTTAADVDRVTALLPRLVARIRASL